VLACGRRWGKTRLGSALCLETAINGGAAWWVAPTYKVAAVGWRQLKGLAAQLDGARVNLQERKVELPAGGWMQVRSADDPDSLRGEGLNRVVMDECAFIAESAWTEAIRPALSDRKGDALFISTPKGQNWFWRLFAKGQRGDDPAWRSWRFASVSNPFLDAAEVEAARHDLPERVFQQEYLAEFIEDAGGVFRGISAAVDAGRTANDEPEAGRHYTLGVDLARVEDFTVLTVLDDAGRQVYHDRFNQISWERQVGAIVHVGQHYDATVYMDSTGVGDPIFEQVRKALPRVVPYGFTNTSKERLIDNLAVAIEQGKARLLDLPTQTSELQAYQYELTASRNVRMNAPEGMHDDCVIGLALAAWGVFSGQGLHSAGAY
jgi:hypothetical protein